MATVFPSIGGKAINWFDREQVRNYCVSLNAVNPDPENPVIMVKVKRVSNYSLTTAKDLVDLYDRMGIEYEVIE